MNAQHTTAIGQLLTRHFDRRRLLASAAAVGFTPMGVAAAMRSPIAPPGEMIMSHQTEAAATTNYLTVPGARLYYEVSGSGPVLLLIHGAPADAAVFAPIVGLLEQEYTIVRYDTRGISRSAVDDPVAEIPIAVHADDARRILAEFGEEPADVFGSSGGAVIGLALTERSPERVRTLVAHEPPLAMFLPEDDSRRAAVQDIAETYRAEGVGAAMGKFIVLAGGQDAPPPSAATPDPAMLARLQQNFDTLFAKYLLPITTYVPDVGALQAGSSRVVVGVGETSAGDFPHDAALGLAERLGTAAVTFPGGHGGYTEYPDVFTARLRDAFGPTRG